MFILALDQGTTGTTATLTDLKTLKLIGKVNQEFPQIFPQPGWVEHNLNDIWSSSKQVIQQVLKDCHVPSNKIACIGITNQRETVGAFTRNGRPLANAIVWQDRRTANFCDQLKSSAQSKDIKRKTGLNIDPYFSGSKMKWLLENKSSVQRAAQRGDLLFGNMDTFLLYKLSGGKVHKTEASNASRTMLYDLEKGEWDDNLLSLFHIQKEFLPEICDSFGEFAKTNGLDFLPDEIPITGILGDQQAALFGQAGLKQGDIKCTYGTGGFLLLNTGTEKIDSSSGLLTTVAYRHEGKNQWALEGSCYIAGAAVQWLRDQLGVIESSRDVETLAKKVKNLTEMEFLTFLPFFTGIASPHWSPRAKGAIVGMTRDSSKAHLARACLDGVAFSINDLILTCERDLGRNISKLRVDGGMCKNDLFCQIQSNVSALSVQRPLIIETTAYGASLAAAIGLGEKTFQDIKKNWVLDREFTPNEERKFYEKKQGQWSQLVKRLYL